MSSLRNSIQSRQHRERPQLPGREKWGILEKHKDYTLRARDYNTKKQKLKRLEEKARDRHPDEFAFGMMSERARKQGKHGSRDSQGSSLSLETVRLLKTQDAGYLRTVGEKVRREKEGLEREVRLQEGMGGMLGGSNGGGGGGGGGGEDEDMEEDGFDFGDDGDEGKPRKVVFADSRREQKDLKQRAFADEDGEGEEEEGDYDDIDDYDDSFGARFQQRKKSKKQLQAERQELVESRRSRKLKKRAAEARLGKLSALTKQYNAIVAAERELEWQRARMDNSVGGTNKDGIKWKIRERKK